MTIGHTSCENVAMRVQPPTSDGFLSNTDVDGLLGSDFLRQFVVSLDLANDSLYLSPDPNFRADQDRFSTIGVQFAKDPTGFFTIMAVWNPSPASQARLKVGDQVLSVNGSNTIGIGGFCPWQAIELLSNICASITISDTDCFSLQLH
jgi:hypothetical protein